MTNRARKCICALLIVAILVICLPVLAMADAPRKGQKGDAVAALQRALERYGFYFAPTDDIFGKQTERAVARYQAYLNELRDADAAVATRFADKVNEDGVLTADQYAYLTGAGYRAYLGGLSEGSEGQDVFRLQFRLDQLGYLRGGMDGIYSAQTASAVLEFQAENALPETGEADLETQRLLFSEDARPRPIPAFRYRLYISNDDQRVYAYKWTDGGYNERLSSMVCSTGLPNTPTPDGVYRSEGQVSKWCYFPVYGCWAQYAYRIEGAVLFHSVLYATASESTLKQSSVKGLGSKSSHGCVRLSVEDAQWIYDHCKAGTTVVVY